MAWHDQDDREIAQRFAERARQEGTRQRIAAWMTRETHRLLPPAEQSSMLVNIVLWEVGGTDEELLEIAAVLRRINPYA